MSGKQQGPNNNYNIHHFLIDLMITPQKGGQIRRLTMRIKSGITLLTAKPQTAKPKKVKGICHKMQFICGWMYECAVKTTYHDKGARTEKHVANINAMFI